MPKTSESRMSGKGHHKRVTVQSDSGWAGDQKTRKSVSSGNHLIWEPSLAKLEQRPKDHCAEFRRSSIARGLHGGATRHGNAEHGKRARNCLVRDGTASGWATWYSEASAFELSAHQAAVRENTNCPQEHANGQQHGGHGNTSARQRFDRETCGKSWMCPIRPAESGDSW